MKEKCPQTKCAYNIMGGCQKCSMCGCEPNMVDDNCPLCWNCSHDEGLLRWDNDTKEPTEEDIKEIFKDVLKQIVKENKQDNKEKEKEKVVPYVN